MRHIARKRVQIDDKGLHGHIFTHEVDVYARQVALADFLECLDDALVVCVIGVGDLAFPDGLVAVEVIVDIVEVGTTTRHAAAHTAAAAATLEALAGLIVSGCGLGAVRRVGRLGVGGSLIVLGIGGLGILCRLGVTGVLGIIGRCHGRLSGHLCTVRRLGHLTHLRHFAHFRHLGQFLVLAQSHHLADFVLVLIHHAARTTAAHVLGLIQLTRRCAEIARQEAFLYALKRKVDAPRLAVDRDLGHGVIGSRHVQKGEHVIDKVFLEIGCVRHQVVEHQFIQSPAGLTVLIVVELDLEAVTIGIRGRNLRQAGIALGSDADIFKSLAVDGHIGRVIGFTQCVVEHILPVIRVHLDVHGDEVGTEQRRFILLFNPTRSLGKARHQAGHDEHDQNEHDGQHFG